MANSALMRFNLIDKKGNIKRPTRKLVLKKIRSVLPILGWAVPYNWRENLAGDVIAGVTLAVMQVLSGNTLAVLDIYITIINVYQNIYASLDRIYLYLF